MGYPSLAETIGAGTTLSTNMVAGKLLDPAYRAANVLALYVVEGYGLAMAFGNPTMMARNAADPVTPMTDESFRECCESLGNCDPDAAVPQEMRAFDWAAFIKKARAILDLILSGFFAPPPAEQPPTI